MLTIPVVPTPPCQLQAACTPTSLAMRAAMSPPAGQFQTRMCVGRERDAPGLARRDPGACQHHSGMTLAGVALTLPPQPCAATHT